MKLVLLVALALALLPARPLPARGAPAQPDMAAIDRYVAAQLTTLRVPGAALGVVHGDRIVHLQAFGEAAPGRPARIGQAAGAGRPMTPQTPMLIGSLTKSFTAVAIMQLVEQGRVELDAPVQRYIPWFRVADPAAAGQITVRHLLTHSSGLPGRATLEAMRREDTGADAIERQVRALAAVRLTAPVGTAWQYANANYATLGLIIEAVSGQPYEEYVQRQIFAPLQMRQSFTSPLAAAGAGMAAGHQYWFGHPRPAQLPYPRGLLPAGYLASSAEDMSRYLLAHLNGGRVDGARILAPASVAELHRPQVAVDAGLWQGMGWGVGDLDGVRVLQHDGNTANFRAEMWLLPEAGWGFVLLMNASNELQSSPTRALGQGVAALLMGRAPQAVALNPVAQIFYGAVLGVAGLELLAIARGARALRRWRAAPPRGTRYVMLPLAGHLLVALLLLGVAPLLLGGSLPAAMYLVPDLGLALAAAGALAMAWALLRAALAVLLLRAAGERSAESGARRRGAGDWRREAGD